MQQLGHEGETAIARRHSNILIDRSELELAAASGNERPQRQRRRGAL